MIGKGRSDVTTWIDSQYLFLNNLIKDIAQRYYKDYLEFNALAENESQEAADGDSDVYYSFFRSYEEEIYKRYDFVAEARKTIFICIFSYLERGLYSIIKYHKIHIKDEPKIKDLIKAIKANHNHRYKTKLTISNECVVKNFYRLLRDLYIHGHLDTEDKTKQLKHYVNSCDMIDSNNNIINDEFLTNALKNVYDFLVALESTDKRRMESVSQANS